MISSRGRAQCFALVHYLYLTALLGLYTYLILTMIIHAKQYKIFTFNCFRKSNRNLEGIKQLASGITRHASLKCKSYVLDLRLKAPIAFISILSIGAQLETKTLNKICSHQSLFLRFSKLSLFFCEPLRNKTLFQQLALFVFQCDTLDLVATTSDK